MSTSKPETTKTQPTPVHAVDFATFESYVAEVKRLLLEKGLGSKWVDELVNGDAPFLALSFERKTLPVAAAFEVFMTEEESAREPLAADRRLKLELTEQAKSYLQQLVKIGLWGDSVESVAVVLIQQQLVLKLEAGLFRLSATK